MISRLVRVCSIYISSLFHSPRLWLIFLLLAVILLVVTSGDRDLTRDTDGDGLRWAGSCLEKSVIVQYHDTNSRDYVNDPDDDNDGILDIHDDDDDGDGTFYFGLHIAFLE